MPLFTASRFQNCIPASQNLEASGSETSVTKYVDPDVAPTSQGNFGQRVTSITTYDDTANQPINEIETFTLYRPAFYEYGAKVQIPPMPEEGWPLPPEQTTSIGGITDEGWKFVGNVQGDVAERTFKVNMEDFAPPDSEPGDGTIGGFCWGEEKEDARYYNALYVKFARLQGWWLQERYLYGGDEFDGDAYYRIKLYAGGTLIQESDYPGPDAVQQEPPDQGGSFGKTYNLPVTIRVDNANIEEINNSWPDVQIEIIVNPTGASLYTRGKAPVWPATSANIRTCHAVEDLTSSDVTRNAWTAFTPGFIQVRLSDEPDANWKCLAPNVTDCEFNLTIESGGHVEVKFEVPSFAPTKYWTGIPNNEEGIMGESRYYAGVYAPPAIYPVSVFFPHSPLTLNWAGTGLRTGMSPSDKTLTIELKVGGTTMLSGTGDTDGQPWDQDQWGTTSWSVTEADFIAKSATWWYENSNNISVKFSPGGTGDYTLNGVSLSCDTSMYSGIGIAKAGGSVKSGLNVQANLVVEADTVDETTWRAENKSPLYLMDKVPSEDANDRLYDRDYKPTIAGELTNGFPLMQLGEEVGFKEEENAGLSTEGWLTMGTAHYHSYSGSGGSSYHTRDLIALDTTGIDMSYQVLYDGTFKLLVNTTDEDGWPGTFMQPAGENSWMFTLYWYNTTTLGYGFIDRFWWEAGDSTDGYATYTLDASATAQIAAVISGNEYQTTDRHVYLQTQAIPDGWVTDDYAGYTPGSLCIPTEVISEQTSNTGIELFGDDDQTAADILADGNPDTYVRIKGKRKLSVRISGPGIDITKFGIRTSTRGAIQPRSAYSFWSTAVGANAKFGDAQIKNVSHDDYDIRLRWRYYDDSETIIGLMNHKYSGIDQDDLPNIFWGSTDGTTTEGLWNDPTGGLTPDNQDNMWMMIKGEESTSLDYYFDVSSAYVLLKPLCVGNINLAQTGLSFEPSYGETS